MRRICLGGSFNPIHHGHLICARAAAEAGGFDRVVLIPAAQPPHKPVTSAIAPAADRLAMCRLAAVEQNGLFEVDDLEIVRGGSSYTIDTARALRGRGWDEIWWLIGADMLQILPKWHEAEKLVKEVRFAVMARPGSVIDWDRLSLLCQSLRGNVLPTPLLDISATEIRQRVAEGKSIAYLTPAAVAEYIRDRGLYRPAAIQE